MSLRKKAGLPTSGRLEGAVMPAPDMTKAGRWSVRPISCAETTRLLRTYLQTDGPDPKSHSLVGLPKLVLIRRRGVYWDAMQVLCKGQIVFMLLT